MRIKHLRKSRHIRWIHGLLTVLLLWLCQVLKLLEKAQNAQKER
jgi:hypothetical protein